MTSSTKSSSKPKSAPSQWSGVGRRPGFLDQIKSSPSSESTPPKKGRATAEQVLKAFQSFEMARNELQDVQTDAPDLEQLLRNGRENLEQILKTLEALEPTSEKTKSVSFENEILELAKKQSQEFKANLIEKKLVASSGEICKALGFTRQALSNAVKENRMFFLQHGHRRYYPVFYADTRFPRYLLEDITQALGDIDGAQKWQFFTNGKGSLSGKTPLEALQEGQVQRVLIAANGFVER